MTGLEAEVIMATASWRASLSASGSLRSTTWGCVWWEIPGARTMFRGNSM